MADERIPTGMQGFDKLIEGGLPKGSLTLVSGTPGTGKSIFCIQILYNNALQKKNSIFITFEQSEKDVQNQMAKFGWGFDKVDGNLKILSMDSDDPDILSKIQKEIIKGKYDLVVIDSLASLAGAPIPPQSLSTFSLEKIASSLAPMAASEESLTRMKVKMIINYLKKAGITALLTSEMNKTAEWLSRDTISEFLCDGIILLKLSAMGDGVNRTIEVAKMRETKVDGSVHSFDFEKNGIVVE